MGNKTKVQISLGEIMTFSLASWNLVYAFLWGILLYIQEPGECTFEGFFYLPCWLYYLAWGNGGTFLLGISLCFLLWNILSFKLPIPLRYKITLLLCLPISLTVVLQFFLLMCTKNGWGGSLVTLTSLMIVPQVIMVYVLYKKVNLSSK